MFTKITYILTLQQIQFVYLHDKKLYFSFIWMKHNSALISVKAIFDFTLFYLETLLQILL